MIDRSRILTGHANVVMARSQPWTGQIAGHSVAVFGAPAEFLCTAPRFFSSYLDEGTTASIAEVVFVQLWDLPSDLFPSAPLELIDREQSGCERIDTTGPIWRSVVTGTDGSEMPPVPVYHMADAANRRLIIAAHATEGLGFLLVMRAVRSFLQYMLMEDGWLPFHAAAVVVEGNGVLIAGDKFSGKTTTLTLLSAAFETQFVSNDNVYMRAKDDLLEVLGLPKKVGIRAGTAGAFRQLQPWRSGQWQGHHPNQFTRPRREGEQRSYLTPEEFTSLFGATLSSAMTTDLVIAPRFAPQGGDFEFRPLSNKDLCGLFRDNYLECLGDEDPYWSELFQFDTGELRDRLQGLASLVRLRSGGWSLAYSARSLQSVTRKIASLLGAERSD